MSKSNAHHHFISTLWEIVIKHEVAHFYNSPYSSFSRLLGAPACLPGSLTNARLPSPSFNFLTFSLDIPAPPHIPVPWHTYTKHHNYLTINLLWKFAFDFVRKHCNQVPEGPSRWAGLSAEMHCRIKRFSKWRSRRQAGLASWQGGWVQRPEGVACPSLGQQALQVLYQVLMRHGPENAPLGSV